MPISTDWKHLGGALENGVRELLDEMIDGAITELDGPIRDAGAMLAIAARRGRQDLVAEVQDQLALIVLEKELRLRTGGAELFDKLLGMGLNALVNGAIGGLGALRTS